MFESAPRYREVFQMEPTNYCLAYFCDDYSIDTEEEILEAALQARENGEFDIELESYPIMDDDGEIVAVADYLR